MEQVIIFLIIYIFTYVLWVTVWVTYFSLKTKKESKLTTLLQKEEYPRFSKTTSISILFIGDSIVRGVGARSQETTLGRQIKQHYRTDSFTLQGKDAIGISECSRILKEDTNKYNLIIIFCGGMDIVTMRSFTHIKRCLTDLFKEAKHRAEKLVYITPPNVGNSPIFPFPLSYIYKKRSQKFQAIAKEISSTHSVTFISLYQDEKDEELLSEGGLYATDKTHPNDKGYKLWFSKLIEPHLPSLKP